MNNIEQSFTEKDASANALGKGAGNVLPEPVDVAVDPPKGEKVAAWNPHVEFFTKAGNVAIHAFDTEQGELPYVSPDRYPTEE